MPISLRNYKGFIMKSLLSFIILLFTTTGFAQDPCNKENVSKLLDGYPTEFYSRIQANDCLIKAKSGGVQGVSVQDKGDDLQAFSIQGSDNGRIRYLKQNKKDFFITKNLIGKYKVHDKTAEGNKVDARSRFIPKACELTKSDCEKIDQNFNSDFCRCDPKEARYCGDKKWSFEKKEQAQKRCSEKSDYTWADDVCECRAELFCGEKKWSRNKKEKEAESCLDKKGTEWDDEKCSCTEKLYCGDLKWSLKKLEKEESNCADKKNHVWNPDTCSCDLDSNKIVMCKGKPIDGLKIAEEKRKCEEKNEPGSKFHYGWVEESCSCEKEKVTLVCAGEPISQRAYDRKKEKCLERQQKDDRWSWVEEECDCVKEKEEKVVPLCGGKKMSQRKIDRKKSHCDEIKGAWDPETCKCKDPCYDVEESEVVEEETCTDNEPKLGDVLVGDIAAKVCEKSIPDSEKEKIKAKCQEEVQTLYDQSPDKQGLGTIAIKINYTSNEQVLCGENVVSVQNNQDLDQALPANVPTTDPTAFEGDCHGKSGMKLKGDMNKYRPYGKITCDQFDQIKEGHEEIVKMANDSFDKFFADLKLEGPISSEKMDEILKTSNFDLQVIGTANRSNNGTGITLDQLALKRKEEAERVIRAELTKKLQSKVVGGSYVVNDQEKLFTYNGVSQAVGPLNPASSLTSMKTVLNEPEAPAELKKCSDQKTTKSMYDCSVDYFVDKECPSLAKELQAKFCAGDKEELRKNLKSQTTADFLADFKMFQVGIGMTNESKTPIYADVGTIEVDCSASINSEEVTYTESHITKMLKVTKPGFFRRLKKDCREERKQLNEQYGRKNVRKAANKRKNPNGIVIEQ